MSFPQRGFKPSGNGGLGIENTGDPDRHQGGRQGHMASSSFEYQAMSPAVSSPMSAVSPHHPTQSVSAASSVTGTSSRRTSFVLDSPVGAFSHSSAVSGLGKAISNPRQISRHPSSSSSSEDDDLDQGSGYGLDTRRLSSSINHSNNGPDFSSSRFGSLAAAVIDDDAMSDTSDMSSGSNTRFSFSNSPHLRTAPPWWTGLPPGPPPPPPPPPTTGSTSTSGKQQPFSRLQPTATPSKPLLNTKNNFTRPDPQNTARSPSWGEGDSTGGSSNNNNNTGEYSGFREAVRRPVSRTANLRPRPKMLMRVLNQLSEESTPFVSELRSEAAVTKSFKDDMESDSLNRSLLEQFDRANEDQQHKQSSTTPDEGNLNINTSKDAADFGHGQTLEYNDHQSILYQMRDKNTEMFNQNRSSSSSDYRQSLSQSPVSGSEFSPFHQPQQQQQQQQPLNVERQPLKRKSGRDVREDESSLKRRAVSPGLQQQNSPIGSPRASFAAARRSTGGGIKYISGAHTDFMNMSLS